LTSNVVTAVATHLEVIAELKDGKRRSLEKQVLDLMDQGVTFTRAKLRDSLGVKNERLGVIPIGKSEPVSIVRGEPPDLSSILVSPSEALF